MRKCPEKQASHHKLFTSERESMDSANAIRKRLGRSCSHQRRLYLDTQAKEGLATEPA
jgi:hypothetical protein